MERNGMLLLEIFAYLQQQPWILQGRTESRKSYVYCFHGVRCSVKYFFCPKFLDIQQRSWKSKRRQRKPTNKAKIALLCASMVVTYYIKFFYTGGGQTQRYFNVSSPSSRREIKLFIINSSCSPSLLSNPFQPNVPFLYPLKTSENQKFSDIYGEYRHGTLG